VEAAPVNYFDWLRDECGYLEVRVLPDGQHWAGVMPLMFTEAIIVGRLGDTRGYENRWCYHTRADAIAALKAWDGRGEPQGWHRHPPSGRRREIGSNNDILQEWVAA
jgi:hypothetical protein